MWEDEQIIITPVFYPSFNAELREDGTYELREDISLELRQ